MWHHLPNKGVRFIMKKDYEAVKAEVVEILMEGVVTGSQEIVLPGDELEP